MTLRGRPVRFVQQALIALLVAVSGGALRGEAIFIVLLLLRNLDVVVATTKAIRLSHDNETTPSCPETRSLFTGLPYFMVAAQLTSFLIYFSVCGTLQLYFYVARRHRSGEWKCQPTKFLTPKHERHEILLGSFNAFTANIFSALLGCYIYNGGTMTSLYFNIADYGWTYFFASFVLLFLYEDAVSYYLHRIMHLPFFYKLLHKWHHKYTVPTAFSATAFHPIEWWTFQFVHFLPAFVAPLHAFVYVAVLLYNYYYGLIDHSGVYIESCFPWQQPSLFHDYHHRYSRVNYGLNTKMFDWMHGTLREIHKWRPTKNVAAVTEYQ